MTFYFINETLSRCLSSFSEYNLYLTTGGTICKVSIRMLFLSYIHMGG